SAWSRRSRRLRGRLRAMVSVLGWSGRRRPARGNGSNLPARPGPARPLGSGVTPPDPPGDTTGSPPGPRMAVPPPRTARAAAAVTAVWAAMSVAAVGFVLAFGMNFPFMDEWATVPALAAPRPDPAWLWERHNEHLLPLPRLLYWAAFRLTGDLRAGMLL